MPAANNSSSTIANNGSNTISGSSNSRSSSNGRSASSAATEPILSDAAAAPRLERIRRLVARPMRWGSPDPQPAEVEGVLIGNKYHAADVANLLQLGVTAVLNCASGGISRLPVDELQECGIRYAFTNVRQDDYAYPILHDSSGTASKHLQVARQLYDEVVLQEGGKVLFFCVAGMNRSAALAIAVLMLFGHALDDVLERCAPLRPFILENKGFQRQLVELEVILQSSQTKRQKLNHEWRVVYLHGEPPRAVMAPRSASMIERDKRLVEIELLIPGLCTMDVKIPLECGIATVKETLVNHANQHFLSYGRGRGSSGRHSVTTKTIAKSWLVLAMFGYDPEYDCPLETEALERNVQLKRIRSMFNLTVKRDPDKPGEFLIRWTEKCRFALVIFSVYQPSPAHHHPPPSSRTTTTTTTPPQQQQQQQQQLLQVPWTFVHEERPGAPATFLHNNLMSTHARAWDFVTGQAYASEQPIVFSYSDDARDRHAFMKISTSANEAQQFHGPGEGNILGMGANAIVHRVKLKPTSMASLHHHRAPTSTSASAATMTKTMSNGNGLPNNNNSSINHNPKTLRHSPSSALLYGDDSDEELSQEEGWDAALKRPFSLSKMLAMLASSSEAGLAKRVRFANRLNSDGRVLYFYGLGVAMSANVENNSSTQTQAPNKFEYKWEAVLLARYEATFSSYTMRLFMEDYCAPLEHVVPEARKAAVRKLQSSFSIISVKVLLVSLLNAFRDLTLMGVQAFDFNHLNNVLVSRDHTTVRLIDIDGNAQGSIQFPSEYIHGGAASGGGGDDGSVDGSVVVASARPLHKPALHIDLNSLLPTVILKLLLGKGRGNAFCTNTRSDIWKARTPEEGKAIIQTVLWENFYAHLEAGAERDKAQRHVGKVAEWFYALLKKQPPWDDAMTDIYNAMRAIDHLPIT